MKQKVAFAGRVRIIRAKLEGGVGNEPGWTCAAMSVDVSGELRPQRFSAECDDTVRPVGNAHREVDGRAKTHVTEPLLGR